MSKRLGALLRETQAGLQFVSTWRVSAANLSIRLPLEAHGEFDFLVDWGDGKQDKITAYDQPEVEHTYMKSGNYVVRMQGKVYGFAFGFSSVYRRPHSSCSQIVDISHWGDVRLGTKGYQFYACENLRLSAQDVPNLSNVFDLSSMFEGARSFTGDLREWDTSKVDNMSKMFKNAVVFNCNLSSWNTSAVTDMEQMFAGASAFNSALRWDTRMCLSMRGMFQGATAFNGDVSTWDTSKVRTMEQMFNGASSFNGDVSKWDVQAATSMAGMFMRTRSFRNGDISKWKPSSSCKLHLILHGSAYVIPDDDSCSVLCRSTRITTVFRESRNDPKENLQTFHACFLSILFDLLVMLDFCFDSQTETGSDQSLNVPFGVVVVTATILFLAYRYAWKYFHNTSSTEMPYFLHKAFAIYIEHVCVSVSGSQLISHEDRYIILFPELTRKEGMSYINTIDELIYMKCRCIQMVRLFLMVFTSSNITIRSFLVYYFSSGVALRVYLYWVMYIFMHETFIMRKRIFALTMGTIIVDVMWSKSLDHWELPIMLDWTIFIVLVGLFVVVFVAVKLSLLKGYVKVKLHSFLPDAAVNHLKSVSVYNKPNSIESTESKHETQVYASLETYVYHQGELPEKQVSHKSFRVKNSQYLITSDPVNHSSIPVSLQQASVASQSPVPSGEKKLKSNGTQEKKRSKKWGWFTVILLICLILYTDSSCSTHYDCNSNQYCSEDPLSLCWSCHFCEEYDDAIDGVCPVHCTNSAFCETPTFYQGDTRVLGVIDQELVYFNQSVWSDGFYIAEFTCDEIINAVITNLTQTDYCITHSAMEVVTAGYAFLNSSFTELEIDIVYQECCSGAASLCT